MKLLAIDTSSTLASVSTLNKNLELDFEDTNKLTHSEKLLKLIDTALNSSDLNLNDIDYLLTTNGPGSFTGARIGVVTIKGLAAKDNKKIIAVSTLEIMATQTYIDLQTSEEKTICVMLNAKNNRAYYGIFKFKKIDDKICYTLESKISNDTLDEIYTKLNNYNNIIISSDMQEDLTNNLLFTSDNFILMPNNITPSSKQLISYFNYVSESILETHLKDTYTLDITYARMSQAERIKNGEKN